MKQTMIVTGYCPCTSCCGPGAKGITASGTQARPGIAAADFDALPKGTQLDVPSYGQVVVEDTGGGMRQSWKRGIYHIDLCFGPGGHSAALRWGKKQLQVTILGQQTLSASRWDGRDVSEARPRWYGSKYVVKRPETTAEFDGDVRFLELGYLWQYPTHAVGVVRLPEGVVFLDLLCPRCLDLGRQVQLRLEMRAKAPGTDGAGYVLVCSTHGDLRANSQQLHRLHGEAHGKTLVVTFDSSTRAPSRQSVDPASQRRSSVQRVDGRAAGYRSSGRSPRPILPPGGRRSRL